MFRRAHTQRVKCNLRLLCFGGLASLVIATLAFTVTQIAGARFDDRPLPQAQTDFIRQIPLTANDVVYSPLTKLLYASVPSSVGSGGNSITTIDPTSGAITSSVFIGSEPNKLALSDDGNTLYASLEGAFSIRRFDVSSQIPGLQFPVGRDSFFGVYQVADLAVAPEILIWSPSRGHTREPVRQRRAWLSSITVSRAQMPDQAIFPAATISPFRLRLRSFTAQDSIAALQL